MNLRLAIAKLIAHVIALLLPPSLMKNKRFFRLWENRGYHVIPNHFYEPIPDTRRLKDELWTRSSELIGIDMNEKGQINLLSQFSSAFKEEYEAFPLNRTAAPYQYYVNNPTFGPVDGEILYCMVRYFKPRRIIEVGGGNSTYLLAQAIQKNKQVNDHECELITVEPYPNDVLKSGFAGLSMLIPTGIQDVPLSEFAKLRENDILSIDSSHVLTIGSDVQYEYLEVLPRLAKGVIVHCHDIFLPGEYPKSWVMENYMFWTEQYLLQAFLSFNNSFGILWAGCYMHLRHPDKLEAAFSKYKKDERGAGSFWMRRIR